MFTGIVEELGRLESLDNGRLRIGATQVLVDVAIGESIAVNGCCLTVVAFGDDWSEADVSGETISRTSLSMVEPGDGINLEWAVASPRNWPQLARWGSGTSTETRRAMWARSTSGMVAQTGTQVMPSRD